MKIPAFDLTRQYKKISNELLPLLEQTFSKGQFILGENVSLL